MFSTHVFTKYFSVIAVLLVGIFTISINNVPVQAGDENVCPKGNVKAEWEDGWQYEYTDNSATIGGDKRTVTWSPASGYQVTGVCIKYATELHNPSAGSGSWST
ncbi:MAG: hypothetical protein ACOX6V_05985 [Patescibacteria group bacterium]|jgi:hypothetical protein